MLRSQQSRGKMPPVEIKYHTDGLPILLGRLVSVYWYEDTNSGGVETQYATIEVDCPFCKHSNGRPRKHSHGWAPGIDKVDGLQHRGAHCDVRLSSAGYYIGINPTADHVVDPAIKVTRPGRAARKQKLQEQLAALKAKRESGVAG